MSVPSIHQGQDHQRLVELFKRFDVTIPEPEPVAVFPDEADVDDQCWITPDAADLDDLADMVESIIREGAETFPGRRNWRRWKLTRRFSSFLYTSGITRDGGSMGTTGADPIGGWICTLPSLRRAIPHRSGRLRPYLLGKPSWWWECQWSQRWVIRGRHTPIEPFAFGVCAACIPCPSCGEPYWCASTCREYVG